MEMVTGKIGPNNSEIKEIKFISMLKIPNI
jgi:hypothetical protein